jgi:NAD(P)-dependent dehydrogenase (short-subunit alcohol dehydrogenase family)
MDLKLGGRTALVTGASKGIGLAIAQWFSREGAHVIMVARSKELLETEAAAIRKIASVSIKTMAGDLADAGCRDKLVEAFPEIDILVNNAGAIPGGSLDDVDDKAWREGWELKVFGYVNLTRAYLAKMKTRRRGVIVNIIGLGGDKVDYNYIAGAAGNASLMAFTRAIGGNSPEFGVRVVGINPGPVLTQRVEYLNRKKAARQWGDENRWRENFAKMPFGRPANPEEIAATAVFVASDLCSYTSGTILTIDGGLANRSAAG